MKVLRYALVLVVAMAMASAVAVQAKDKSADMQSTLEMKEKAAWDAFKTHDSAKFYTIMSKDGCMIDQSGINMATAAETMMKDYELKNASFENFKVANLSKDVAMVTYKATIDATYKGTPVPAGPWYCSSIYVKKGKDWMAMSHQETMGMTPGAQTTGQ